jgi:uncharacterized protein (TIGR00369 family)
MKTLETSLDDWLAAEAIIRQRIGSDSGAGVIPADLALSMDGLALMQAMIRGELPYPPIGRTLGFALVEATFGRAVFQGIPGPEHLNPLGSVHGGWFATLLDSALGCAVHTTMPAGRAYTTTDLNIKLVRAITPKVQRVRAIGEVVHSGRQLATAGGRIVGPDGKLYAHATTTCLVFEQGSAGSACGTVQRP